MKVRKSKDIKRVLQQKGFVLEPSKYHHDFYFLKVDGKKHAIYTYISHSIKEYGPSLMSQIKKQLKFDDNEKAEDFFDCHLTGDGYALLLKNKGLLK